MTSYEETLCHGLSSIIESRLDDVLEAWWTLKCSIVSEQDFKLAQVPPEDHAMTEACRALRCQMRFCPSVSRLSSLFQGDLLELGAQEEATQSFGGYRLKLYTHLLT